MIASSADLFGLEAKMNELMSVTGAEPALQHDRIERKKATRQQYLSAKLLILTVSTIRLDVVSSSKPHRNSLSAGSQQANSANGTMTKMEMTKYGHFQV